MSEEAPDDLKSRLMDASMDDRLADGMLYREAMQRIEKLEREVANLRSFIKGVGHNCQQTLRAPPPGDEQ